MYLFNERIDGSSFEIWKSAAEWLGFSAISGIPEDALGFLTFSENEIKERQALFRDVADDRELTRELSDLERVISDLEEVRRQAAVYSSKTTEQALYTIRSFSLVFDAVDRLVKIGKDHSERLRSDRLKEFFAIAEKFGSDREFSEDREYIKLTAGGVDLAKSMTLCVNLDAKLEPYEVGVLEVHDRPFAASSFFTGLLGDKRSSDVRHISPLVQTPASGAVKETVYRYLSSGISRSLKKKTESMTPRISRYVAFLSDVKNELAFLARAAAFADELRSASGVMTYPEVSDGFDTEALRSEKLLISGGKVVPNDVRCSDDGKISLLTGANNGGKSVFINMVGVTQIMFQLGLAIPARRSAMKIVKKLYCHFPNVNTDRDSRFVDECRRMKKIVDGVDGETLILMDESFSSTGDDEGCEVASAVLGNVGKRGAYCFFSTHLHALGELVRNGSLKMTPMAVTMDGDTPTYRIEYGKIDDYSHAMRIAKEFGLV